MKKINQSGFVLAETLIVTVFIMLFFAMIYTNFFPLIGEYEKRENYDNVDEKYSVYWLKRMIESTAYLSSDTEKTDFQDEIQNRGYVRFQCTDLSDGDSQTMCKDIVSMLQVNGCSSIGDYCDIFITKYQVGTSSTDDDPVVWFKDVAKRNLKRYSEDCGEEDTETVCMENYINTCNSNIAMGFLNLKVGCDKYAEQNVFSGGFQEYVFYLPNYAIRSVNDAQYRVLAVFHNKKDSNNYYSYATIEVNKPL